ncbi:MAG: glutathione S-transferase family protein [Myxococcales bacterium]|nr:glutathione S-transferase family protein [Myxococcales bacterium]
MLIVYGVPNSQPVRAVLWLCLLKGLPFELRMTSQDRHAKRPEYLDAINPRGTIPAIDDGGVVLWESHAIMIYLCEKHGWTDYWPADLVHRARVNQYLHFHHRNTRELVQSWSQALWPTVFGVEDPDEGWLLRNTFVGVPNNEAVARGALEVIESLLATSGFIAGGTGPTLADLSAYEELGQNQPKYANCTDFSPYPRIRRWLLAMEELPHHREAHAVWEHIGDARKVRGGMRTIAEANKGAARAVGEAVAQMHPGSSEK